MATATATKPTPQTATKVTAPTQNKLPAAQPPANVRSVLFDMSDRYGMEPQAFEQTLRNTVVPKNCSREQFAAFLLVAKEYKLNPLLKEIYAFPAKSGGIQPIVGVDGWANLINSHPAFDGMEFIDETDQSGNVVSITCRMHRKDREHPIAATEYMAECRRTTDPWKNWPRRMLRHKAMIQAARYAFGFAGIVDPDEAERFTAEAARDVTPRRNVSTAQAFDEFAGSPAENTTGEGVDQEQVDATDFDDEPAGDQHQEPEQQSTDEPQGEQSQEQAAADNTEGQQEQSSFDMSAGEEVRRWPPGEVPSDAEEYEHYVETKLSDFTEPEKIPDWWKSAEEGALRKKCGLTRAQHDALRDKAAARKAELVNLKKKA